MRPGQPETWGGSRLSHKEVLLSWGSWTEELACYVVPSDHGEEIAVITVVWTLRRKTSKFATATTRPPGKHLRWSVKPWASGGPVAGSARHPLDDSPSPDRRRSAWSDGDSPMCRIATRRSVCTEDSLEGSLKCHQSWAISCQNGCRLPEIHKGYDRNEELKRRLQSWEAREVHDLIGRVFGEQHTGQQAAMKNKVKPQTEVQRGKRACAWAPISKAVGRWRSCGGHGGPQESVDHSSDSKKLRQRHTVQ